MVVIAAVTVVLYLLVRGIDWLLSGLTDAPSSWQDTKGDN